MSGDVADTERAYSVSSSVLSCNKTPFFSGAKQLRGGGGGQGEVLDHDSINQISSPFPIFPAFFAATSDHIT